MLLAYMIGSKTLSTRRKVLLKPKLKYWKETKANNSKLITLKRLPNQIPATYPARPQLNPTHLLSLVPVEPANMKVAQS